MKHCDESFNAFRLPGEDWELNAELTVSLEGYACHLYRYRDTDINKARKKKFNKKFLLGKNVMDLLLLLPPCHSTCRRELEMFFTQWRQALKHNWERLGQKQWNCLGWWYLSRQYYGNLGWWRFWKRNYGTQIRSSRWLYCWKYWWLKLQFHLVYMLYSLIIKNMKNDSWKLTKCFASLNSLKYLLKIEGFGIAKPLTVTRI